MIYLIIEVRFHCYILIINLKLQFFCCTVLFLCSTVLHTVTYVINAIMALYWNVCFTHSRQRRVLTRDRCKLFLKKHCWADSTGIWRVKVSTMQYF